MTFPTIAIAFTPASAQQNPNIRATTMRESVEGYLKAATVCFASVRRWNPEASLIFVTSHDFLGDYSQIWHDLEVQTLHVNFDHRPPERYARRFEASLYLLDALNAVSTSAAFIDPDVLCLGAVDTMLQSLNKSVGVLDLQTPPTLGVNGLSLREAVAIYRSLGVNSYPRHFGGEFYYVPAPSRQLLLENLSLAWEECMSRFRTGDDRFITEEHFLSFAASTLPWTDVSHSMGRVWTARRHRVVPANYEQMVLWHLPAEKERGFRRCFESAVDQGSWFWKSDRPEFRARAAKMFGVERTISARLAMDSLGYMRNGLSPTRRR